MTKSVWLPLVCIFLFAGSLGAQNRSKLESEREQLLKQISASNKKLSAMRNNRENALANYLELKAQVQQRQRLLETYQKEIELTSQNIARTDTVIQALDADLSILRKEYGELMRTALRTKVQQSYLFFLFSADNLNDAFKRLQYLRQYDKYRKRQSKLITDTQESLSNKLVLLEEEKERKDSLVMDLQAQDLQMRQELIKRNRLLSGLKRDEKQLVSSIEKKENAAKKLNQLIENIIQKELLASRKKTKVNKETAKKNTISTGKFVNARGRLPWPVQDGTITKPYGVYKHPKFKNVKITNNGIDIGTSENAAVKAVFSGTVAGVQFIPGFKNTVILQHGKYYTVYSNLSSIYVKRNDEVQAGQEIGKIGSTEPEMHFEIWREKERLDPSRWIVKQ